ncbi:MAG TPA: hypothetical protein VGL62_00105, partial [Vicinamibacterales bacterium]
ANATAAQPARDALSDHYWVQYQDNNEWIDLDPLIRSNEPRHAVVAADQTVDPGDLDASLKHSVTIRVVVEQWKNGQLQEHELLSHTLSAADAMDTHIALSHFAPDWPHDLTGLSAGDSSRVAPVVIKQSRWVPVLHVDDKAVVKDGFAIDGEPFAFRGEDAGPGNGAGALGGGMFGALAGGAEVEKKPAAAAPVDLTKARATAEWIEFDIEAPGRTRTTIRREIFDALGPAARSGAPVASHVPSPDERLAIGEHLLANTDVLIQAADIPSTLVLHNVAQHELSQRDAWMEAIGETDRAKRQDLVRQIAGGVPPPSQPLVIYALARQVLNPHGADLGIDVPNIVTYRTEFQFKPQGTPAVQELMDVVENERAVRPAAPDAFAARLGQGIADTAAEVVATSGDLDHSSNTLRIVASADSQRLRLIALFKTPAAAKDLRMPADAAARLQADVAAGFAVVMPSAMQTLDGQSRIGWWRVEPGSGTALGIMDTGFHQDDTEITSLHDLEIQRALFKMKPGWNSAYIRYSSVEQLLAELGMTPTEGFFNGALEALESIQQNLWLDALAM